MADRETYRCANCGDPFTARAADRKRGWARYCSKSCKAIKQTQRTGRGRGGAIQHPGRRCVIGNRQYAANGDFEGFVMGQGDLAAGGYGDADWNTPFGDGKW